MVFSIVAAILLLISLVFLILANVSSPVSTALKVASEGDYTFGIFGYCKSSTCPSGTYPVSFGNIDSSANWFLSSSTRNTLSKAFIVAPIAAGLVFLALVFTAVLIFFDTSLVVIMSLVFTVLAFLAAAVSCVMVVLVFHPYVAWAGWILVAAAALTLIAIPMLILAIRVHPLNDEDGDDEDTESKSNFVAYNKIDSSNDMAFAGPTIGGVRPQPGYNLQRDTTNDDESSLLKDSSYRGATRGYTVQAESADSLYNSQPRTANDITKAGIATYPNGSGSYYEDASVNLNNGPSTPVSAKQKMAPNFVPAVAVKSDENGSTTGNTLPYPQSERGSVALNSEKYGVFDHHPNVEGHQPFTELGDELPENQPGDLENDDDSDFTSISQRQPNVAYNQTTPTNALNPGVQAAPNAPGAGYRPVAYQPQPHQQQYPNVSQYQPHYQQQYQQQGYQQQGYQQQYPQPSPQALSFYSGDSPQNRGPGYLSPYGGGGYAQARPQKPSVADNVLNNNPDFSLGGKTKRKQFGNPAYLNRQGGQPIHRPGGRSPRDGPYGMI